MSYTRRPPSTDPGKDVVTRRSIVGKSLLQARQVAQKSLEPRENKKDAIVDDTMMSVVVVTELSELEKYSGALQNLADAAIEPNVFYEPWMLIPALRAYGEEKKTLFALVQATDPTRPADQRLCGFFPLEIRDYYDGISNKLPLKTLRLWRKPEMTYLCAPLLRDGYGQEALAAFFDWIDSGSHNCSLLEFCFITGEGPIHHLLVDHLNSYLKFTYVTESYTRALFRPAADADAYLCSALRRFRRKEYRRQERRLAETGLLEYTSLEKDGDFDGWVEQFLELESNSWKGKGGRALVCDETDREYFVEVAREAFRRDKLMMLALRYNGRPIACKLNFLSGFGSFAFKIAFDEEFARYSPGVLLELENIRLLHNRPEIKWMDSCADPDRFMINHLWPDRRVIQTIVISTGKPQGDFALAALPMLKWGNRQIFRRDLLSRGSGLPGSERRIKLYHEKFQESSNGEDREMFVGTRRLNFNGDSFSSAESDVQRPPALLDLDSEAFCAKFNRAPFLVGHHLAGHPLFSLERLIELATRLPEENVKYNGGDIAVATGLYEGPRTGLSVQETIRRIEECNSWMVIKNVEVDPEYRRLMDRCLDEVQLLSEPIDPGMIRREGFIFISSPLSITPFHMDPEYNFLLQLRGKKQISVWDSRDRSVLSEIALEKYFSDIEKKIVFKDEYQRNASVFDLTPGQGLHFPVAAPHWVRNGDEVSVSFSITFRTPSSERQKIVYCANAGLRKRGLNPTPQGASAIRDLTKFYAFRARFAIKSWLNRTIQLWDTHCHRGPAATEKGYGRMKS